MSQADRYQLSQFTGTIGARIVVASANQPKNLYEAGKRLQKDAAKDVRIHDTVSGKEYDLAAFAKEHRLK